MGASRASRDCVKENLDMVGEHFPGGEIPESHIICIPASGIINERYIFVIESKFLPNSIPDY